MVPHVGRWQLLLVVTIVAFGVDANGFQLMRLMKKISKMRHLGLFNQIVTDGLNELEEVGNKEAKHFFLMHNAACGPPLKIHHYNQ
ncbi:hypothetical protein OPV22_016286 [Ensete ventricosum]|uniref:Secreted protein n=1 Tax=Ensete ventricosum TaxID=4639 RepID=A0AAV8PGN1_ENSVE|nr:hypothetical protein OPV22_016286 [Ensete ventricosum]